MLTATLSEGSSQQRPREDTDRACSQAPDSLQDSASNRDLSAVLGACSRSLVDFTLTLGLFQETCHSVAVLEGGWLSCPLDQISRASYVMVGCREERCEGKMALTRGWEACVEARKADGASSTALRTPSPPDLTGKEAWDQYGLWGSSGVFVTLLKMEHNTASYSARDGDLKQGAVCNRYVNFGIEKV